MSRKLAGSPPGVLDHVQGGHGQTGAVDDAADVPFEPHVAETAVDGRPFPGVLLGLVPQLRHVLVAEQGVVVEGHLGVQRQ